jgi:hypothetical protein
LPQLVNGGLGFVLFLGLAFDDEGSIVFDGNHVNFVAVLAVVLHDLGIGCILPWFQKAGQLQKNVFLCLATRKERGTVVVGEGELALSG